MVMKFGDLDHMTLAAFMDSAPRDALWFFVHVPKTAGSSFSAELARDMRPYTNVHIDYTRPQSDNPANRRGAVEAFIAQPDFAAHRSASGHIPMSLARGIREARPDTQFFSILRSPLARVVSDYRYQRTPQHPPHREFIEKFPDIAAYAEVPGTQNKMARFLTGKADPTLDETLRAADEDFAFIGLLEMYPMSFNIIFSLMGIDGKAPAEHKRKTPDTPETRVEMTPELAARIEALNATDMALYRHVRRRLVKHRDAWKAVRRERAVAARRAAGKRTAAPAEAGSGADVAPGDFL